MTNPRIPRSTPSHHQRYPPVSNDQRLIIKKKKRETESNKEILSVIKLNVIKVSNPEVVGLLTMIRIQFDSAKKIASRRPP